MRSHIQQPAWKEQDLGTPLPDSPHAVSVCLPTWESVLGYEESDPSVTDRMQCGYPRFFRHPLINELFASAAHTLCGENEAVAVFPHAHAASRATDFLKKRGCLQIKVLPFQGLFALIFPADYFKIAMEYWRYTGEIVSSRQAEHCLKNHAVQTCDPTPLLQQLSSSFNCEEEDLFLYENGMSAAFSAFRAAHSLQPDKKTLQLEFPYVDVLKVQQNFGQGVEYLNFAEGAEFDVMLLRIEEGEFSAIFCELPSNPLLRSVDVALLSRACKKSDTCLVIDDTICSHYNVDVSKFADIITTSMTKWISGKGDVMAGAIRIGAESLLKRQLSSFFKEDNPSHSRLFHSDQEVLTQNLKGFESRIKQANFNAQTIVDLLSKHVAVEQVWYPSLTTRENYDKVKTDQGGYGGLVSFALKNAEDSAAVFDALEVSKGPSLGTEFSLACPYTLLAHYDELEWAKECGVPSHLIRISVGIEAPEQLIKVIHSALSAQGNQS